ncbi:receptor-like protein EIX2 [Cajanus cajan]|uniref:receptor-like protein EIX2 n=1 Tax=Cajanus cajan TaxID=3821 RepID=UPI0010FBA837|nr:receptor-like protein EIX2 [Cajanus cajan]
MSNLKLLELSDNSLALEFSQNFAPSFQLAYIRLRSCKLGPTFPKWFQTQNDIEILDISNCGISDFVPEWFWSKVAIQGMTSMNISFNNLKGTIPNFPTEITPHFLILASNQFEGPIPPFLRGSAFLDLSQNNFSDSFSFLCANDSIEALGQLDLSNNQLSGQIPDCWNHFKSSLAYLDLSHNNFSGMLPTSMGSLLELQALILSSNSLTKEIPVSLSSCTKLVMLDLGENRLSGLIPSWIGGKLQKLQILSLRKNHFSGSLPLQLCYLKGIQLLDLSLNNLSGRIPKCFKNFTAMSRKTSLIDYTHQGYSVSIRSVGQYMNYYDLYSLLTWKGAEQIFLNNELLLLKSIDLSSNHLSEEIPKEFEKLLELISLNLSRNNLTGEIPSNIGSLTSLEFLDLSRNKIFGPIPSSLTQIDRLSMLDLSHNHLSGEIPIGTQLQSFDASSYEDNPNLCGKPLEKLCVVEKPPHELTVEFDEDEDFLVKHSFYVSMAFGFITGFGGIFCSILVNRTWRQAYYKLLNTLTDHTYLMIVVKVAKLKRWLQG